MKTIQLTLSLLLVLLFSQSSFAVHEIDNSSRANVFDSAMSADQVLNMNAKKYKALTGEKMKFTDRIALSLVKAELKYKISKGEDLSEGVALGKAFENFSIGGFLLGLFLGLIGVIIALFWKDKKVRRSAWKGVLVWLLFLIVFGINLRS